VQKKSLIFATSLAAAFSAAPNAAYACRASVSQTPILHRTLPALPDGVVAAEVQVITDKYSPERPPLEARIISMIKGDYAGTKLRIEPHFISSCDVFPQPGDRGFAVGRVLSRSKEALVIDPIRAPSAGELHRRMTLGTTGIGAE
jgi:hypothetical protein